MLPFYAVMRGSPVFAQKSEIPYTYMDGKAFCFHNYVTIRGADISEEAGRVTELC